MKRLTIQRLKKEFEKAKSQLDGWWNDVEIQVDGRNIRTLWTKSPEEAFEKWKEEVWGEYRHISVRLNHIDENKDIQDVYRVFEHEAGY